jgi:hypothetical protein
MGRKPRDVTDAELAILQVLWDRGSATIRALTDARYPPGGPSDYATVKKLLARLESKGIVPLLKKRLTKIMEGKTPRFLSFSGRVTIVMRAALLLPVGLVEVGARATGENDKKTAVSNSQRHHFGYQGIIKKILAIRPVSPAAWAANRRPPPSPEPTGRPSTIHIAARYLKLPSIVPFGLRKLYLGVNIG